MDRFAGLAWFAYLVATCLILGFGMGLSGYVVALLISLPFPSLRRVSDAILHRTTGLMLELQPWLDFDGAPLADAFDGLRKRSKTGVLLVSNHRSHLDTFLLLARVPGVRVLAKRGLFAVPLLGLVMWTSRQIPIRRRNLKSFVRAMDAIEARLRAGEVVHVFPEMTRAEPAFDGVAGFNPAPFLTAVKVGAPILPIALTGTGEVWPKGSFALRRRAPVRAIPLAPILPEDFARYSGAKELSEACRREIEAAYRASAVRPAAEPFARGVLHEVSP